MHLKHAFGKQSYLYVIYIIALCLTFSFISCGSGKYIASLKQENLFSLNYGSFDNELNLFDLESPGAINTSIFMKNGFFYIANGESRKVMEMNSYGDLLTLYHVDNGESNRSASFMNAITKVVNYPFNEISSIAIDGRKYLYVVDKLPSERQEKDENSNQLLTQIVLRFDSDGNFLNYLGQQGQGGTPFPVVSNIYTTENNDIVVVTRKENGLMVYWFNDNGWLKYTVPFTKDTVPNPHEEKLGDDSYVKIVNAIPDYNRQKLYVMVNYYSSYVDEASRVQAGIKYEDSMIYPINLEDGSYDKAITIPSYAVEETEGFSKTVYEVPYDLIGITRNGWYYFFLATENGFQIQMVQNNGQKIIKRALPCNLKEQLYFTYNLNEQGILSALVAKKDKVDVIWWRSDLLIESMLK